MLAYNGIVCPHPCEDLIDMVSLEPIIQRFTHSHPHERLTVAFVDTAVITIETPVNSILQVLHAGMRRSKPFFDTLVELDLLESFVLDAQLYDGSEHRLSGFYTINEEALKELTGEQLEMLNKRGYLEAIYMAIASMTNLPLLLDRKNQLYKAKSEHAEH